MTEHLIKLHDTSRVPIQARAVQVSVLGRRLQLPELALSAGLSDLRLATGEYVGMEDYATGVALVLEVLARQGLISLAT
jgi:hypothetical protein